MPASTSENNFRFINSYSHKGIKTSKDTRRDVRSYVARISHTNSGRGKAAQSRENGQRSKVICEFDLHLGSHTSVAASVDIQGLVKLRLTTHQSM